MTNKSNNIATTIQQYLDDMETYFKAINTATSQNIDNLEKAREKYSESDFGKEVSEAKSKKQLNLIIEKWKNTETINFDLNTREKIRTAQKSITFINGSILVNLVGRYEKFMVDIISEFIYINKDYQKKLASKTGSIDANLVLASQKKRIDFLIKENTRDMFQIEAFEKNFIKKFGFATGINFAKIWEKNKYNFLALNRIRNAIVHENYEINDKKIIEFFDKNNDKIDPPFQIDPKNSIRINKSRLLVFHRFLFTISVELIYPLLLQNIFSVSDNEDFLTINNLIIFTGLNIDNYPSYIHSKKVIKEIGDDIGNTEVKDRNLHFMILVNKGISLKKNIEESIKSRTRLQKYKVDLKKKEADMIDEVIEIHTNHTKKMKMDFGKTISSLKNNLSKIDDQELFSVAILCLEKKFVLACKEIKELINRKSNKDVLTKKELINWPIFAELRKTSHFKKLYENAYGSKLKEDLLVW